MAVGKLRRSDRAMPEEDTTALLQRALVGRIGTVDADGMPYVVPLNFVYEHAARRIHLHFAKQPGHLTSNLKFSSKVCFEVDEPGPIIARGETGCETSHVYESVICFGRAQVVSDERERERIARLFLRKYVDQHMPDRSYKPGLAALSIVDFATVEVGIMTGTRRPSL
ncbi:MAG: pyridoxamine 5'-phosphate oxidase family protein [Dehalococcoidia bacterium]|nr:MAG: pyridoxamine 5'-phosphate oxidase family protein [Dehalococcoidia bacterium]